MVKSVEEVKFRESEVEESIASWRVAILVSTPLKSDLMQHFKIVV